MRRVAEQRHAARAPAIDRIAIGDVVAKDCRRRRCLDERGNGRVPAREHPGQPHLRAFGLLTPSFGRVVRRIPIDAVAGDRDQPEPPAASQRLAGYTAWRGIAPFRTSGLLAGETLGRGQRFGLVPIAGDRVYWYATDNVPEGESEDPEQAKTRLTDMFANWHAPIPALIAATEAPAILRNDIYDRDPVDRWGEGRVTLLGDAAHPMTPNLGQGGCQAIEDALLLARCLAEGGVVDASLRRYESLRIPRTRFIVNASRRIGRAFQMESPILCRLRDLAIRMTPASMSYRSLAAIAGYEGHLDLPNQ